MLRQLMLKKCKKKEEETIQRDKDMIQKIIVTGDEYNTKYILIFIF